jgi:cell shape-determining protein MreC
MATAAKAKLLLRELKTVKADLAFAKARSSQLEEENKLLREREGSDKGLNHNDDDLVLISFLFTYVKFVLRTQRKKHSH